MIKSEKYYENRNGKSQNAQYIQFETLLLKVYHHKLAEVNEIDHTETHQNLH